MNNKTALFIGLLSIVFATNSIAQNKIGVGFYNLENLFDTEDDPLVKDEEYLPNGRNQWTTERYESKLNNMAKVVKDLRLSLIGLCEVENRRVLEDLINTTSLKTSGYDIIHVDSPDRRGIDVAALYKPAFFKPISISKHPVINPAAESFKTRDILHIKGIIFNTDTLHFLVNHWPSRAGGGGQDKRVLAATVARNVVDSLLNINPEANIILTGDFNDDPINKSIKKVLRAGAKIKEEGDLINTSLPTFKLGQGTLMYKGAYNLFDQIIISKGLSEQGVHYQKNSFSIGAFPYLRHNKGEEMGAPFRTFSRGKYLNGYSDHFPVYILLEK